MAQLLPISFENVADLTTLGVTSDFIRFGSTTLESDRFVTICGSGGAADTTMTIVDLANGCEVSRHPIKADAAIMNPASKVIALRAERALQIFDLDLKARVKASAIEEEVVFWRWISDRTVALVTTTAVFHWSVDGDAAPPEKVFDRHGDLGADDVQIINYQVSGDAKWSLLIGIFSAAGSAGAIGGKMQLFSVDKKLSQMLRGHAGVFTTLTPEGRGDDDPAQLLCFEEQKPDSPPKLFIMEVGRAKEKGREGTFRLTPAPIPVPSDAPNDFLVAMQASQEQGIIYAVSKCGYVYLFDVFTGRCLYRARITQGSIFATCPTAAMATDTDRATATAARNIGGILCITARLGQVLRVTLNVEAIVPYIRETLRDSTLAAALASRMGLPGAEDLLAEVAAGKAATAEAAAAAAAAAAADTAAADGARSSTQEPGSAIGSGCCCVA